MVIYLMILLYYGRFSTVRVICHPYQDQGGKIEEQLKEYVEN